MESAKGQALTHKIHLPRPISVNNLTANVAGRGRVATGRYNTWKRHASALLMTQQLPRFTEPVSILYAVGEIGVSPRCDGDNTLKALNDALVRAGVIPDDSMRWVRSVGMEWIRGKDGVTAYISPAATKATAIEVGDG